MEKERDVAHQINHDLGLNPSLDSTGSSDKRLEKLREFHADDLAAEAAAKEDDP
ncbi:MAG: hypothetical protein M3N19_07400 [Candidatus Eremiobacteraeota bacterium]|nr:hypothetical protein [Candidatus Eremiobacteraeota bacterium]